MNLDELDPRRVFAPQYQKLMEESQAKTEAVFANGCSPAALIELTWEQCKAVEHEIDKTLDEARSKGRIDMPMCKKGCYYCCHQIVGVLAPEVFLLVDWIRANWNPLDVQALRERLKVYERALSGLSGKERLGPLVRCPLLLRTACSVHVARPIVCRSSNSTDVQVCIDGYRSGRNSNPPPFFAPQRSAGRAIRLGFRLGLAKSKMKGDILELGTALDVALREEDSLERWLSGEHVFEKAEGPLGRSSEVDDILAAQDRLKDEAGS